MENHPMETRVSLLELQLRNIERDAEKREKLQDARHAETMATLAERQKAQDARHAEMMAQFKSIDAALASSRDFSRGVASTVKAAWAVAGTMFGAVVASLVNRWMTP